MERWATEELLDPDKGRSPDEHKTSGARRREDGSPKGQATAGAWFTTAARQGHAQTPRLFPPNIRRIVRHGKPYFDVEESALEPFRAWERNHIAGQ